MRKHRRTIFLTISSVLFAVAPKCPFCFLAYFGIFGAATASASVYRVWLPPFTAIWLALTVAMLALRRDRKRKYGPIAVGIVAGLSVFSGKFTLESQLLLYAGIAALIVAAVWGSWPPASKDPTSCSQCEPQTAFDGAGNSGGKLNGKPTEGRNKDHGRHETDYAI